MTTPTLLANIVELKVDDPIAFTFFIGYMAMLAASVFFFAQRSEVEGKWRLSMLVSALITGIAAVHYYYMRDYYLATHSTPTALRYIDWTLTVPLMCVEFYLLTKAAGAKIGLLWKLIIASVFMLVTGYIGEAFSNGSGSSSIIWGTASTVGYIYIVYTAWFGEVAKLSGQWRPGCYQRHPLAGVVRARGLGHLPHRLHVHAGQLPEHHLRYAGFERRLVLQHRRCHQQNRLRPGSVRHRHVEQERSTRNHFYGYRNCLNLR